MTWNYRVVEREAGTVHHSIGIYEVYYGDDKTTPTSIAEHPTYLCVDGDGGNDFPMDKYDGEAELWRTYELMRKAFNKKMLRYEDI